MLTAFSTIALCLTAGYVFAWVRRDLDQRALIALVLDVLMPALILDSLISTEISAAEFGRLVLATVVVVALLIVPCIPVARLVGMRLGTFAPPVLFMNSGFIGIPLLGLLGGAAGTACAVTYDQVQTLMIFSLGLALVAGRSSGWRILHEMGRSPIVWSIAAAALVRGVGLELPEGLRHAVRFVGAGASPVALVLVGVAMRQLPVRLTRSVVAATLLRIVGGAAAGFLVARLLHLEGTPRMTVTLLSALPSAVFSYVLASRYDAEPAYAAATVVATTAVGLPLLYFLT